MLFTQDKETTEIEKLIIETKVNTDNIYKDLGIYERDRDIS